MKKALAVLLALLLCAALLPAEGQRERGADGDEQVTLQFWGWLAPEQVATYRAFEDQYPNIKIQESLVSQDWASSSEKFLAAMAAGQAPDVSVQNRHQFKQWASQGPFLDLTDLAERDGVTIDDFYPVQFRETMFDGKLYGLPWSTDTRFLYWNKDHFREVGLDPEQPPETWEELEEYTALLNKRNASGRIERYGFIPYYGNTWTWLYGWLNGGEFLSEDKKTVTLTDDRIAYALQWMVDFYDEYAGGAQTASSFLEGFQAQAQDPFVTGQLSMVGTGNWQIAFFAAFPDLDYGMAPMPIPNTSSGQQTTWSCGGSIAVSANTQYPEEAWTLTKWLTGPEYWRVYATEGLEAKQLEWEREELPGKAIYVPDLACSRDAAAMLARDFTGNLSPKVQAEYQLAVDALEWTYGCGEEMGLVGLTFWNEVHQATEAALYHQMSVEEALEAAEQNVQTALDEAWARVRID